MASLKEQIKDKYRANKKIINWTVGGILTIGLVGTSIWIGTQKNAYAVVVDGDVVAIAQTREEIANAYEQVIVELKAKEGTDIAVNEQIVCEAVHSRKSELANEQGIKESISHAITYKVEAYEISVDGRSLAVVSSEAKAQNVLTEIAKSYLPREGEVMLSEEELETVKPSELTSEPVRDAKVVEVEEALPQAEVTNVVSVGTFEVAEEETPAVGQKINRSIEQFDFNEEVKIRNVYVEHHEVLSEKTAKERLQTPIYEVEDYTLVEGDNVWDIAMQYDTTVDRILELNPNVTDEMRMQIGQEIEVEKATPILSITTVEESTYKQMLPSDISYVVFTNLYKGQTQMYQRGKDGLKEVTVAVSKVNGEEVSRELVNEKVLSEPTTTVIGYGVKEKPMDEIDIASSENGSLAHPLKGAGRVSSGYGVRWGAFHKGIDFAASAGTPIYAAISGKVVYSGYNSGGYGNLVIIESSNGYQTYYAHCSKLYVNVGEKVAIGERIAGVGSTGNSTGNHLHFEIRRNGSPVNPSNYL